MIHTAGLVLLFGLTPAAFANAGVPMIFVLTPLFGWAIVPIVVVEGYVLSLLPTVTKESAYFASFLANAASTMIGIPLTWMLLVALQIATGGDGAYGIRTPLEKLAAVTWQGAWLIPYEDQLYWMVPAACLFLLAPFFLVSLWIERFVCIYYLPDQQRDLVRRSVLVANSITYGILALLALLWLARSILAAD